MENSKDLIDKNIILTGASRGLGAVIAEKMWLAGANLMLVDKEIDTLNEVVSRLGNRSGQVIFPFFIDLSTPDASEAVIKTAKAHFNHIDILVNNAAIQGPVGPLWENDWILWKLTIKIDLLAPVDLSRHCAQWMIQHGKGKIICLSGGGATSSRPNFSAYAVAKTGLVRFCEILADELSPYNIQVNCIAPGVMSTAILDEVLSAGAESAGQKEYEIAKKVRQQGGTPLDRVAELVIFLSSAASNKITGKLISAVWDPWEHFSEHITDLQKSDIYTLRRIIPKDRSMNWGDV